MPTELPKNIIKLIIAFLKHQAENLLGENAIAIAGDILIDFDGKEIYGKIDDILSTNEGTQKLLEAALRADTYFREKCTDQDLRGAFAMPVGDLPSVQEMLKTLPNALDYDGALKTLSDNLATTFPNIKMEQIEYGATLYLDCLSRALMPLRNFALPIIGQTVLESRADIKEIKVMVVEVLSRMESPTKTIIEIPPPLPQFAPHNIDNLDTPGGALKLNDPFYVERKADELLKNEVSIPGRTITICAARQTGKTSILFRGMEYAKQNGTSTVYLNAQTIDKNHLASIEVFLRTFAEYIFFELGLDTEKINQYWSAFLTPQQKLNNLLQNYVFAQINSTIIIGMDEIDKLFETDYYSDFFALVRSWHDNRARDKRWEKLTIAMVISTEPYLLISNFQSPFNVGKTIYLEDFDDEQVAALNFRHNSPIEPTGVSLLVDLIGGHPYLTRQALYVMVTENLTWNELEKAAINVFGPFGSHLLRYVLLLQNEPIIEDTLKKIILDQPCSENIAYRLVRAGLVKKVGKTYKLRCSLYDKFFKDKYKL
jgi:hypothetical protein